MRLDIKYKLMVTGISFIAIVATIYHFINSGYIDYKLIDVLRKESFELESNVLLNLKEELEVLENFDLEQKNNKEKNNYSIYEIENNTLRLLKGSIIVDENSASAISKNNRNNYGFLVINKKLVAIAKKEFKGKKYIVMNEIYSLENNNTLIYEDVNQSIGSLSLYDERKMDFGLAPMKILKYKGSEAILIIDNYLEPGNFIKLEVNKNSVVNDVLKNAIIVLLLLYGTITVIFGIIISRIMNKNFFNKIQSLENRIKDLLEGPDKPKEIIKELNLDSIDYIENNINSIISSVNEYKEIVNYYSKYDSLTSLMNRETFIKEGDKAIENGNALALIYINLDGFSYYNNNFGYVKGDEILREVSRIILRYSENHNMVARIGGDEFGILVQKKEDFLSIQNYVEGLINEINLIKLNEKGNFISASVGVSIKREKESSTVELINNAYLAMVSVKEKQKNSYEIFTLSHKKKITIGMIQKALDDGAIQIHYQPKINVKTNKIDGVEALVRWFDEEKGYISPMDFIKVAEDTGYIITFGEWILRNAIRDIKKMNDELEQEISVAINVSPIQFMQKNFVKKVEGILSEEGLSPKLVELELTESIGIFNSSYVTDTFEKLSDIGLSIAIDDFGTGYSSVKYLKEFKINTIKIDKSFVQGGGKNISIIKYIIEVSKILGFSVVAEGIEEYRQARILKNLSCDYMQGYFFYKPMPIQKLYEAILKEETVMIN